MQFLQVSLCIYVLQGIYTPSQNVIVFRRFKEHWYLSVLIPRKAMTGHHSQRQGKPYIVISHLHAVVIGFMALERK